MAKAKPRVAKTASAVADLIEIGDYLAQVVSLATAERFLTAAEATFEQLAKAPGIGTRYESDDPAHADLRYTTISKFRNHVVFYRPTKHGIEVVRVLHAARDLGAFLGMVEEDEE